MDKRFYFCKKCGNMVEMIKNSGNAIQCCNEAMQEMIPGTSDGAVEKHIPVYTLEGNQLKVQVGSVEHPMVAAHYIEWVSVVTKEGTQRKALKPEEKPEVSFSITEGDEVESVYAYCNLHGLWKA